MDLPQLGPVAVLLLESRKLAVCLEPPHPVSQEILSPGNSVAATEFPRKYCRGVPERDTISYWVILSLSTKRPRKS